MTLKYEKGFSREKTKEELYIEIKTLYQQKRKLLSEKLSISQRMKILTDKYEDLMSEYFDWGSKL